MILSIFDYNHKNAFYTGITTDPIINLIIANNVTQQSQEAAYISVPSDGLVTVDDSEMMIRSIVNHSFKHVQVVSSCMGISPGCV